ncbi:MAG: serine/threonine protein kinase [Pyrinomonadaceae bacterium]|nr:serine/threonine protein kinase [Pyrinomonadaceae bacterium]
MLVADTLLQNRYRLIQELGRGGMGAVYEATDQRLKRRVALKESRVKTDDLKRAFEREARLLANLNHPLIPRVIDHFSEGDGQYLVMDFLPGDDLGKMLRKRKRPFTVAQVLYWANDLLDVLEYLHTNVPPIIHKDIKPANLKLNQKGKAVLLDFGLAKGSAGEMVTVAGDITVPGYSLHYAPLEQIQGSTTTPRSDLYALAATLYHLLTGNHPLDALTRAAAFFNNEKDPLPPILEITPKAPARLASVLMQALRLKPAERPASASAMRASLQSGTNEHQPAMREEPDDEVTIVPTDRAR